MISAEKPGAVETHMESQCRKCRIERRLKSAFLRWHAERRSARTLPPVITSAFWMNAWGLALEAKQR